MISHITILSKLFNNRWDKCSDIVDYLNQFGPMGFYDDEEYHQWKYRLSPKQKYNVVYRCLDKYRKIGVIDSVLGDNQGNEVRTYKLRPNYDRD